VGLIIDGPRLPGPNTSFWPVIGDGDTIGKVTSAVHSPRLEQNIALAIVSVDFARIGTEVEVVTDSGPAPATVVDRPFFDPKKTLATT
jgi:aminomethyltransferase